MNAEERAAVRARIEATTPAPWDVDEDGHIAGGAVFARSFVAATVGGSNAEFIVHAREDLPAALDAIDRVLALHQERDIGDGVKFCSYDHGDNCAETWPCDIIQAIEGGS